MSSPTSPQPASGRLPHLGVLRFSGRDAQAFLQGQISNDARRLAEGSGLLAAYSSAQGRVLAVLHLLPLQDAIAAILPRELIQPTIESLRRYVLRAKVSMEDAGESLWVHGAHDGTALRPAGLAPTPPARHAQTDGIVVGAVDAFTQRFWVIGSAESLARHGLAAGENARVERDWRLADIRAGLPQVYAATREAFVAQMLNLDLVGGISFNKGCYTGQEIIARAQHLGRIKRRLHRLQFPAGGWEVGQTVCLADGRSGRLTEVAANEHGCEALAVLPVQASAASGDDQEGAAATVVDAQELALPYAIPPLEARAVQG